AIGPPRVRRHAESGVERGRRGQPPPCVSYPSRKHGRGGSMECRRNRPHVPEMRLFESAVRPGPLGLGEVSQTELDREPGTTRAQRSGCDRPWRGRVPVMGITMERKRMLQVFKEARHAGPYDEFPVLLEEIDPQLYLS